MGGKEECCLLGPFNSRVISVLVSQQHLLSAYHAPGTVAVGKVGRKLSVEHVLCSSYVLDAVHMFSLNPRSNFGGKIIIPILQMTQLRLKQVKRQQTITCSW